MKKGQIYVRAIMPNGRWGNVDVMELNDESFRALVLDLFVEIGLLVRIKDEFAGEKIDLKADPDRFTEE